MTFLRLRKMPKIPSVNRIAATDEIMAEPDDHDSPCPDFTLTISIAVAVVRAT